MTKRLAPYGSIDHAGDVAKVGKVKAPQSLAARMPSPDIVAKVGGGKNPVARSLAARMPSPEIAAKVGEIGTSAIRSHRVVRRNGQG